MDESRWRGKEGVVPCKRAVQLLLVAVKLRIASSLVPYNLPHPRRASFSFSPSLTLSRLLCPQIYSLFTVSTALHSPHVLGQSPPPPFVPIITSPVFARTSLPS